MYFLRGSLPWQGLKAHTKQEKYNRISDRKQQTPIETLCRGFPTEFGAFMNYIRGLRFEDKPDYSFLKRLFRELFVREGYHVDYVFDWTLRRIHDSLQEQQSGTAGANAAGANAAGVPNNSGGEEKKNSANNTNNNNNKNEDGGEDSTEAIGA
ncbi:hypothetical protein STCU_10791 [Strigomonas culicis]|uniref:Uncharacterized protein n=1 Tax=Strigomonas culicis TaxID=28005 RepID=S9TLC6_9TRYP|nr:hypothetical protein STCU_10791 [Strigomonas culicis]|eukprot:EPY17143.1 hypothetical protein STCU_10791 [Strigomonas culicis]